MLIHGAVSIGDDDRIHPLVSLSRYAAGVRYPERDSR
jgi:hypothetical protein